MTINVSKDFKVKDCVKVKHGKVTKLPKSVCKSKTKIDKLLDKGFVVTRVGEQKTKEGHKSVIESFSPNKRPKEGEWIKKALSESKGVSEEDFYD
jgi:hypothetical protein